MGRKKNRRAGNYEERIDGSLPACETLETRVLPAVDLIVSAASLSITGDPPVGSNQYSINFSYKIKNLGTTPIDLTGVANDVSDNVRNRVYGSLDENLDVGDPLGIGFDLTLVDNGPHVLNQNDELGA
ncbi:MAG: hypothetical protein KDA36_11125, partial [Planctomycetaceae bacterium]|nr:hypothetical protein [Planctomycetaceae bacterium]